MAMVEAKIEGPIKKIESDGGNGLTIAALGVAIHYSPGPVIVIPTPAVNVPRRQKSIRSPSQRLTVADLLKADAFVAVSYGADPIKGFTGGTIIAEGFFNTDVIPPRFDANHLQIEIAETVLIGTLTSNTGGKINVNGVEIVISTDPRMSSNPDNPTIPVYLNDSGFSIQQNSIAPTPAGPNPPPPAAAPPPSASEGYFGNDGRFYAHLFEYGGPGLLLTADPSKPQISIERAEVRDEGTEFDIEVRGHVTTPHQPNGGPRQTIELFIMDMQPNTFGTKDSDWVLRSPAPLIGNTRVDFRSPGAAPFTLDPPIQRFRFRGTLPKDGINPLPPERIQARNRTAEDAGHIQVREKSDTDVRE